MYVRVCVALNIRNLVSELCTTRVLKTVQLAAVFTNQSAAGLPTTLSDVQRNVARIREMSFSKIKVWSCSILNLHTWEEPKRKAVLFLARVFAIMCYSHGCWAPSPHSCLKAMIVPGYNGYCYTSGKKVIHRARKFMITHILAETNSSVRSDCSKASCIVSMAASGRPSTVFGGCRSWDLFSLTVTEDNCAYVVHIAYVLRDLLWC